MVGQCQVTLGQILITVTLKNLRASVIYTTLGQDSDWTQSVSDQGVGHQELTFSTCESQSQDQDSPVPELSATIITFNPCESQSQDQDSPVPELSATTIANRLVLYPCHRTK